MRTTPIPPGTTAGTYLYRISSTGYGSSRYGVCEVCRKQCVETSLQVESVTFECDGAIRQTYAGCSSLFGHAECLVAARRTVEAVNAPA